MRRAAKSQMGSLVQTMRMRRPPPIARTTARTRSSPSGTRHRIEVRSFSNANKSDCVWSSPARRLIGAAVSLAHRSLTILLRRRTNELGDGPMAIAQLLAPGAVRSMSERVGTQLEVDDQRTRRRCLGLARCAGMRRVDAFNVHRRAVA